MQNVSNIQCLAKNSDNSIMKRLHIAVIQLSDALHKSESQRLHKSTWKPFPLPSPAV